MMRHYQKCLSRVISKFLSIAKYVAPCTFLRITFSPLFRCSQILFKALLIKKVPSRWLEPVSHIYYLTGREIDDGQDEKQKHVTCVVTSYGRHHFSGVVCGLTFYSTQVAHEPTTNGYEYE